MKLRLCIPALLLVGPVCAQVPTGPQIVVGPYLQHVTQTSIAIMWETGGPATSVVEYGLKAPPDRKAEAPGTGAIHEVALQGLEPETQYVYRVLSADGAGGQTASDVFTFGTAVQPTTPFAFAVVGDSRTYPDRWKRICQRVWGERPNLVLHVGDVVTNGTVKEQWSSEWLKPAEELMRRVTMYVAIGNHERNAHWYYDYVSYPKPENYYSFDYGNAHFAMVDSNQPLAPGSDQYRWLDADLGRSRARWKFVAHHHPPYSSDADDYGDAYQGPSTLGEVDMRQVVPLYEKHKVDMVFVGHIHDYERTWPMRGGRPVERGGVIYVQAGGGGAELEDFAPTRSPFTAKLKSDWQYCLVAINGATLQFYAHDIEGRLFDTFELRK
jgi:Calcineurin-like phosphoesterase/Purple acid Phosphatase, N-terminal domain